MDKGIFSKTFATDNVDANFSLIKSLGYQATQFNFASAGLSALPEIVPDNAIRDIAAAVKEHGIRIEAISATFNMTHPDPTVIEHGLACLDSICAAAAKLDCPLVTLCTGTMDAEDQWRFHPGNNTPEAWQKLIETMTRALKIAARYDVYLGIEPELANVINSAHKARLLIDELGSPYLKVIFDPANLFEAATIDEQRHIVSDAIQIVGKDIAIAHAKDRNLDGTFATAGSGVLDYSWYLGELAKAGFDGCIVTHGLDAGEAEAVSQMLDRKMIRKGN